MAKPGRPKKNLPISPALTTATGMHNSSNQPSKDCARGKLLEAAKTCFTQTPYHKVTTRMLAAEAGVTPALIRYYFINKEGLYKAMFEAVTGDVLNFLESYSENQPLTLEMLPTAFQQVIKQHPQFPVLMMREMVLGEGHYRDLFLQVIKQDRFPRFKKLIEDLQQSGQVRSDINPIFLHLHMMSITLFPWIMRSNIEFVTGLPFDNDFADNMLQHNLEVLKNGCKQDQSSDNNNTADKTISNKA